VVIRPAIRGLGAGLLVAFVLAGVAGARAAGSQPSVAQQGLGGLAPPPPGIQQGNQPTLAERYPPDAYTPFHIDLGAVILNAVNPLSSDPWDQAAAVWASNEAGTVMDVILIIGLVTSSLLEWAFSLDLVAGAGGPLAQVVRSLAHNVYEPLLATVLGLVGIWLVWHLLLRRRTLMGLEGAAWTLGALVLGGLFIAAPVQLMSGVNEFTSELSRGMLGAVGTADPQLAGRAGDPALNQGDAADAELRLVVDRYWRTYVFTPWCMAEVGDVSPTGQRLGQELLAKQSHQPSSFDSDLQQPSVPQDDRDWYNGGQAGTRLAIVLASGLVILGSSVLYLLIALAVVVSQLGLLALLMTAPLFLLVGIHPGAGRRLLVRWLELVAATLGVRVLAAAFLAVVMVLSGLVTEALSGSWWLQAALQMGLVVAALIYRKPFMRIFGQVAAGPRMAASHIGGSRIAETSHRVLDRQALSLWRARGAAGRVGSGTSSATRVVAGGGGASAKATKAAGTAATESAAGTGATAAGGAAGAATGGLALVAVEAGKLGVRAAAHGVRRAQGMSGHLLLDGAGHAPPAPRIPRSSRGLIDAVGQVRRSDRQGLQPAQDGGDGQGKGGRRGRQRATDGNGQGPKGRNYTNWKSGETVNVVSSKIHLAGGWERVRSEKRS
jgi:TrbL/VirB6 plasmid conjugal transfer protein